MRFIIITIIVLTAIFSLPSIFPPKSVLIISDAHLRRDALSHDLKPVPRDYASLRKAVDSPENPLRYETIELGKKLFFDPILSRDRTISCASCHDLEEGGDDNRPTAIGFQGRSNPYHLNSPTVLNAALAKRQFWDARVKDVEEQSGGPIQAVFEMNMTPGEVVSRLKESPEYSDAFQNIFDEPVTFTNVRKAIGAYERTLLTYGPFDAFLDGNDTAISPAAKRGLALFIRRGCKGCHTGMSVGGQSVQKFPLRHYPDDLIGLDTTAGIALKADPFPFENKGGFLGKNNTLRFRVPILRNITKTSPYFHNGSVEDLGEAVRIMSKYQLGREFTRSEIDDTVEFLKTLEGKPVGYDFSENKF